MYTSANRDEEVFGDTRSSSTSAAPPTRTSRSASPPTSASACTSPGWRARCSSTNCSTRSRRSSRPAPVAAHPLQPQQRVEAATDPPRDERAQRANGPSGRGRKAMNEPHAQRIHLADPFEDWPKDEVATTDERATLMGFLDYQRAVLARKATGLTDEQARLATCPPSDLTMLGLIRHAADVERGWAQRSMAGGDVAPIYYGASHPDGDPDGDFHPPSDATLAEALDSVLGRDRPRRRDLRRRRPRSDRAARPQRVQPALDPGPPDRGARPPLRPRRSAPPGDRRGDRRLNRGRPSAADVATVPTP